MSNLSELLDPSDTSIRTSGDNERSNG